MRAGIAATVLILSAAMVRAKSTDLVVVAEPATDAVSEDAKRVGAALVAAAARSERFEPVDVELVVGGRDIGRAAREVVTAGRDLERGIQALYELRTEEASHFLRSGVAAMKRHPARLTDEVAVLAKGLAYLAVIQLFDGNERRGRELISDALALAPDLEPDKQVFNPPMRRTFAREKSRMTGRLGSVSVSSTPGGALVWVDGVVRGVTPLVIDNLHEGSHVVRVTELGRRSWGKLVSAVADARVEVRAELPALKNIVGLIDAALRAADNQTNAPSAAAALGKALRAEQVLLARVRRLDGERVSVDAVLYGVDPEARLARASVELALANLDEDASALLAELDSSAANHNPIDDRLMAPSSRPTPEPDMLRAPVPAPTDWDRVLAWTLTGGGAAMAITGLALAVHGDSVLGDPASLGEDKQTAVTVGLLGVSMAVVGAAASTWGGWMLWDQ